MLKLSNRNDSGESSWIVIGSSVIVWDVSLELRADLTWKTNSWESTIILYSPGAKSKDVRSMVQEPLSISNELVKVEIVQFELQIFLSIPLYSIYFSRVKFLVWFDKLETPVKTIASSEVNDLEVKL